MLCMVPVWIQTGEIEDTLYIQIMKRFNVRNDLHNKGRTESQGGYHLGTPPWHRVQ